MTNTKEIYSIFPFSPLKTVDVVVFFGDKLTELKKGHFIAFFHSLESFFSSACVSNSRKSLFRVQIFYKITLIFTLKLIKNIPENREKSDKSKRRWKIFLVKKLFGVQSVIWKREKLFFFFSFPFSNKLFPHPYPFFFVGWKIGIALERRYRSVWFAWEKM